MIFLGALLNLINITVFFDLINDVQHLTKNEEGFVVRFENGYRLKIKGAEYCRIHSIVSNCTPLGVWASLAAGDDMEAIRRELPEEFWSDFDQILKILQNKIDIILQNVNKYVVLFASKTDKEVGLCLNEIPEDVRLFIFSARKGWKKSSKQSLYRAVRPVGNVLENYVPSFAINKVMEEI